LIHIVDASGSADAEGNPCGLGQYDPLLDVEFLEKEITMWLLNIIKKTGIQLQEGLSLNQKNRVYACR